MKTNFWYSSRINEIFIDSDNFMRSAAHTNKRLVGAVESGKLIVDRVEMHRSNSEGRVHIIITLVNTLSDIERTIWALLLHSDIYRACSTIMRQIHDVPNPDVLITPTKFLREPDAICHCTDKHNVVNMENCPAAEILRGERRTETFFGKLSDTKIDYFSQFRFQFAPDDWRDPQDFLKRKK